MTALSSRTDVTDPAWLDGLPSIGLHTLHDRAALQTRTDRKYLLSAPEAEAVLRRLGPDAAVLEIDGRRSFGYESVYYDTPGLDLYRLAATGRRRRFKVRIRRYLDSGQCWLEVKTRGPRGVNVKHRQLLDVPAGRSAVLGAAERDEIRAAVGPAATDLVDRLRPVLVTRCRRCTVHLAQAGARLTVDRDLQWQLPGGEFLDATGVVVLETKSADGPTPVDRTLWAAGHRPDRFSKYAVGLALLHPDLPANRWHRILSQNWSSR